MYDLRQNNMYEKVSNRITRANDDYIFETATPNTGIYASSPYYIGAKNVECLTSTYSKLDLERTVQI